MRRRTWEEQPTEKPQLTETEDGINIIYPDSRGIINLKVKEVVNNYLEYLEANNKYKPTISQNVFVELFGDMVKKMKGDYNTNDVVFPESFLEKLKDDLKHAFEIEDENAK